MSPLHYPFFSFSASRGRLLILPFMPTMSITMLSACVQAAHIAFHASDVDYNAEWRLGEIMLFIEVGKGLAERREKDEDKKEEV